MLVVSMIYFLMNTNRKKKKGIRNNCLENRIALIADAALFPKIISNFLSKEL
jgi:hypothetical protein